jgi:16S rRNA (uracil1498-N3)-methyltransferase
MTARLYVDLALAADQELALPERAARHAQVLRLQPGQELVLFNGKGGEWRARVLQMGRRDVQVQALAHIAVDRELALPVTLAVGMPANERFDWLIEKATELGAAAIQPLVCARSVARHAAERAERKLEHWQAVAIAAAEQCGRTRLPVVVPVQSFDAWVKARPAPPLWVLSLRDAMPLAEAAQALPGATPGLTVLSGPEGGLTPGEEDNARRIGAQPIGLGPRVLRAETAPLAVLAMLQDERL